MPTAPRTPWRGCCRWRRRTSAASCISATARRGSAAAGILGPAGARLIGHEFHYASELSAAPSDREALARVTDAEGVDLGLAGHRVGTVTGSFFHLVAADPG